MIPIRLLNGHIKQVTQYLATLEFENAIYFQERINRYQMESSICTFYGSFNDKGGLHCLMMLDQCEGLCRVEWRNKAALPHLVDILRTAIPKISHLVGQAEKTRPFYALFPTGMASGYEEGDMLALRKDKFVPSLRVKVFEASSSDVESILALQQSDQADAQIDQEKLFWLKKRIETYPTFVAKSEGKNVSWAGASLLTEQGANITSVATHSKFRRQGFSISCMSALCANLFTQTDIIYLSVSKDNHEAAAMYESLGFSPLGPKINPRIHARLNYVPVPIDKPVL